MSQGAWAENQQSELNRTTADNWDLFATHRRRLTELILKQASDSPVSLCVLGAGNCNDLDIPSLLERFQKIVLVDIDGKALDRGAKRHNIKPGARISLRSGVDVAGVANWLGEWRETPPNNEEIDRAMISTMNVPKIGIENASCSVVVSSALLSQVFAMVGDVLGDSHARGLGLIWAIHNSHLRLMTDLLARGGVGIVINDMASSRYVEELNAVPSGHLRTMMSRLVLEGRSLSGTDPWASARYLEQDPRMAPNVRDVQIHDPWLWQIEPNHTNLVYALTFRKNQPSSDKA